MDQRKEEQQEEEETGAAELTHEEVEEVEEHTRLRAPVVYEIVRQEGAKELERPAKSLWWSGIAAGLGIGFSVVAEALLRGYLPDEPWRPLLENWGYCIGFLLVILGRQQLFTENTITVVLPLAGEPTRRNFTRVVRLWSIVFAANMVGCLLFAAFLSFTSVTSATIYDAALDISRHMMDNHWGAMFVKGIVAGWLIAAIVWIMPSADTNQFFVVALFTYLIALGDFTHIIAGSVEAFMLVIEAELTPWDMLWRFTVPVFLGNVIGGAALFTMIAYAQVQEELRH